MQRRTALPATIALFATVALFAAATNAARLPGSAHGRLLHHIGWNQNPLSSGGKKGIVGRADPRIHRQRAGQLVRQWHRAGAGENHRVVALDNRNHGKSDKPNLNGPGRAEDTIELMDHLKIDKAHIGGYSMGGAFTGALLATHPERFITAHFGGAGISETDPEWIAKLPKDHEGVNPMEAALSKGLRIHHAMDNGMSKEEAEKLAEAPPAPRAAPAAGAARPAALRRCTAAQTDARPRQVEHPDHHHQRRIRSSRAPRAPVQRAKLTM